MPLETGPALPSMAAFLAVVGVWIVADWSIVLRRGRATGSPQDRGSRRAIGGAFVGGILLAVLATVLVPSLRVPAPDVAFWLGLGTILIGVAVRQYAVRTLSEGFDLAVTVDEDDEVVEDGPYRWVRHPSYTGALCSLTGLGIAVGHWLSVLLVPAVGVVGYGYRIRVEERALRETLGDAYRDYAERTPYRLVPGVW